MKIDLNSLPSQAKSKKSEFVRLKQRLKKRNNKEIDEMMHQLDEEAFSCINCLNCANCCKTTGPKFLSKDVERIAKHFRISPAALTEKYLRIDEDGDTVLQSLPCPFLGGDNYCSIYEVRPKACREYPHTQQPNQLKFFDLTIKNSEICPAVFEILNGVNERLK